MQHGVHFTPEERGKRCLLIHGTNVLQCIYSVPRSLPVFLLEEECYSLLREQLILLSLGLTKDLLTAWHGVRILPPSTLHCLRSAPESRGTGLTVCGRSVSLLCVILFDLFWSCHSGRADFWLLYFLCGSWPVTSFSFLALLPLRIWPFWYHFWLHFLLFSNTVCACIFCALFLVFNVVLFTVLPIASFTLFFLFNCDKISIP